MISQAQLDKELDLLIKDTSHYDNDRQFMAASKLTQSVQKHYAAIFEQKYVKIIEAFLKQLDSEDKGLQSNAVGCLGSIISKLSTANSRKVVDTIVTKIAKPQNKHIKSLEDIYANGLVSIIKQVGFDYGYQLKDIVKFTVDAIYNANASRKELETHQDRVNTQFNLINVAEAFISKWPRIIDAIEFDKVEFVEYLLRNIGISKLAKRSYLCLGALSQSLREKQLKVLLTNDNGLIPKIKSIKNYANNKDYYHALASCLKAKSPFLNHLIGDLFKFIFAQVKELVRNEDLIQQEDGVQLVSKLLDALISSLYSLIQAFPQSFKELSEGSIKQVVDELKGLIVFSPALYIGYIHDKEQVQQQEQQQAEEEGDRSTDDSSFMVRASALQLVGLFSSVNPKVCEIFIDCSDLFQSLKESKDQVRNASFNMFENLFIGISKEEGDNDILDDLPGLRREISIFKEKVPPLLTQVLKQIDYLLNNPKVVQSTKDGCAKLLRQIPRTFLYTLSNDHIFGLIDKLYEITLGELKRTKVLEMQILLTNAIECLARYRDLKHSAKSIQVILAIINSNKNQNLLSAAFTAIAYHLCQGFEGLSQAPVLLEKIAGVSIDFSNQGKLEQTARISINEAILMLLNHYYTILSENTITELLKVIFNKLTIQTNKIHILNGLRTLPQQFRFHNHSKEQLSQIILHISSSLANNNLPAIRTGAQLSVLAILLILGKQFQPHAASLVDFSNSIIDSREFPEFLIELSKLFPKAFSKILYRLLNIQNVHPSVVSQIFKHNGIHQKQVVELIRSNLCSDNLVFCIDILAIIGVNPADFVNNIEDDVWGCLCLRLLGLSGDIKYFNHLMSFAHGNGEARLKENARLALGDLAAVHPQQFIPHFVKEIATAKESEQDLTFVSLQQCISRSDSKSYDTLEPPLIQLFLMIENNQIQNLSVINRIAQSVAKLYSINQQRGVKLLLNLSSSTNENVKYLYADALSHIEPHLINHDLVIRLTNLFINDSLKVKTVAAKSLAYLISINPVEMKQYVTKQLFESIRKSTQYDKTLLIVEVIGTKTVTDKGKPLRIQAFTLAEEIIDKKLHGDLDLIEFARVAVNIGEDFYDDVLLHRLDLIKSLTAIYPRALSVLENEFVTALSFTGPVMKNFIKENDDEATKKVSLSIAKKIFEIINNCKKQNSIILSNYNHELKQRPKFKVLINNEKD